MERFGLWLMRFEHVVLWNLGMRFWVLLRRLENQRYNSRQRKAPLLGGALRFRMSLDVLARQFFVVGHVYNLELFRVQRGVSAE